MAATLRAFYLESGGPAETGSAFESDVVIIGCAYVIR